MNIAVVLNKQDKHDEALNYFKKALALKPDFTAAYYYFASALINLKFKQLDKEVEKIIVSILDQKTIKRTRTIAPPIISLIKLEPYLSNKLNFVSSDYNLVDLKETIFNLSKISILLKVMGLVSIPDLKLEQLFTIIRRGLLLYNSELGDSREVLKFQTALALQCFNNEYIYSENNEEINELKKLEVSVLSTLESGKKPSSSSILCLASYKALYKYDWYDKIKIEKEIDEVFKRQVIEPIYERKLKSSIPVLGRIKNKISTKVREQYEENPYPRWVNLELSLRPFSISKWANLLKLRLFDKNIFNTKVPNVLIAGCGTGQQSIERKTHYKNSQILAIDLSLSSLAYAKRKTEELQVSGIEYMQSDILELDKIEKKFDIIECAGVLHHMDDPLSGWRVLTNCLKKGGLMRIGLYSESARQIIVKIRQEIKAKGIGSTKTEMKSFRNDIIRSNKEHHIKIKPISDFYSLSEFRDLLFHVQEHRFTMSQIKNCLANLGLKFCGFEGGDIVQNFISKNFKKDDLYNLDKWNIFEEANPVAFTSMYQFWCQKV